MKSSSFLTFFARPLAFGFALVFAFDFRFADAVSSSPSSASNDPPPKSKSPKLPCASFFPRFFPFPPTAALSSASTARRSGGGPKSFAFSTMSLKKSNASGTIATAPFR